MMEKYPLYKNKEPFITKDQKLLEDEGFRNRANPELLVILSHSIRRRVDGNIAEKYETLSPREISDLAKLDFKSIADKGLEVVKDADEKGVVKRLFDPKEITNFRRLVEHVAPIRNWFLARKKHGYIGGVHEWEKKDVIGITDAIIRISKDKRYKHLEG
ncbi:hypothetical protein HY989_04665 [Candidatus Micrarchaeota archaeon]|nr:hypothetical protein [Candidatus Micrarchaeota archaeon]